MTTKLHGWSVDLGEFSCVSTKGGADLWLDRDFDLNFEQGSGYMREGFSLTIPTEVVVMMLRHKGYGVEEPND